MLALSGIRWLVVQMTAIDKARSIKNKPALRIASNRLLQILDLHWRSPESYRERVSFKSSDAMKFTTQHDLYW